jgi:hypothetical protein
MWARVARFEGDQQSVEERIERVRTLLASGSLPPELSDAKSCASPIVSRAACSR